MGDRHQILPGQGVDAVLVPDHDGGTTRRVRIVLVSAWLGFFAKPWDKVALPLTYDPALINLSLIRGVLTLVPVEDLSHLGVLSRRLARHDRWGRPGRRRLLHSHVAAHVRTGQLRVDRASLVVR